MTTPELKSQVKAAFAWWASLQPKEVEGVRHPGDRSSLARLRRCASPGDAAFEPATMDLFHALGLKYPEKNLAKVAALAIVLAHVRENDRTNLARVLGAPAGGKVEDARLKPLRFKRLMGASELDDILIGWRRVVQILDRKKANVRDLAELILSHDVEGLGDRIKVRFSFDYYNAGSFAPDADTHSSDIIADKDATK